MNNPVTTRIGIMYSFVTLVQACRPRKITTCCSNTATDQFTKEVRA